jgi:glycosyltransferase involved in cell wall biosynthesis
MKKVLVLSWYPATGSDSGERIRLKNMLESLSKEYLVTLYSFSDDRVAETNERYLDIRSRFHIPYKFTKSDWLKALICGKSIQEIRLPGSRHARKDLSKFLQENTFHVVIANQLPAMALLMRLNFAVNSRVILDTHNAEGLRIERVVSELSFPFGFILKSQVGAARSLEKKVASACDLILTVTKEDHEYFSHLGAHEILTVPNGSHNHFSSNPYRLRKCINSIKLVYLGSLSYSANRNGLIRFLEEFSHSTNFENWRLVIAGSGAPKGFIRRIQKYSNVVYKGYVENSEDFLLTGDAMLVPLWLGGGSRLKIFEGFSLGIPVISSKVGIEGIKATNGKHYFEFESPADLDKILELFSNSHEVIKKVSSNAFRLSTENSWTTRFTPLVEYIMKESAGF